MQPGSFSLSTQVTLYAVLLATTWFTLGRLRSVRQRQGVLLAVSYVLYATWGVWFLAVLVTSSLMNHGLGVSLRKRPSTLRLWIGILLNLLLLSIFKYLPSARFSDHWGIYKLSRLGLPIGISFWTFQALSYLFDVYREEDFNPTRLEFCLYMAFWPTALSGPICRLPEMLSQFRKFWNPCWSDFAIGSKRIVIGVIMMGLSQILAAGVYFNAGVDHAFSMPANLLGGTDVWIMIIGYGFQLFLNFCGYSHLVIGAARLFGYRLADNFNRPYLSTTASEFWTRWHMSLSFWIRDYVFFPLATRRSELWWRNLSLVIAMFIFGLWHKGSLLFMVWGIYHGLLLVGHRCWQQSGVGFRLPEGLLKPASWLVTFAGISLGWIFFRAGTLHDATIMFQAAFSPTHFFDRALPRVFYLLVLVVTLGYFLVLSAGGTLDRLSSDEAQDHLTVFAKPARVPGLAAFRLLAQNRWVWLVPALSVMTLYLYIFLKPQVTAASPMLYRVF